MILFSWWYPWWKADRDLLTPISKNKGGVVGICVLRTSQGAPVRVFYPSMKEGAKVKWRTPMFRQGLPLFVKGYMLMALRQSLPMWQITLLYWFTVPFLFLIPLAYAKVPRGYTDATVKPLEEGEKTYPLLIFSHGLSGTGDEHGLMGATLALRGYVVAFPHHSDLSSSLCDVIVPGSSKVQHKLYKHPDFHNYDLDLRQGQCEWRADEVEEARILVLSHPELGKVTDESNAVVGGFSFGGSTAGLVAVENQDKYKAAVFVDGWWRVNFPQYGIEVDLPKQLHASTMSLPALMLSSTEMFDIPRIRDGQETIKGQCPQVQASVLEGTKHGNFIDTVFWIPSCLSRFVNLSGKMIHPHKTYAEIIQTIATFLDEQTGPGMAEGDDSVV